MSVGMFRASSGWHFSNGHHGAFKTSFVIYVLLTLPYISRAIQKICSYFGKKIPVSAGPLSRSKSLKMTLI